MKKILIIILLLWGFGMKAQNWNPIYTKNKAYFTHEFSPIENGKIKKFWYIQKVDSLKNVNDTIFYKTKTLNDTLKRALITFNELSNNYDKATEFMYLDIVEEYKDTTYFGFKLDNTTQKWKIYGKSRKGDIIKIQKDRVIAICDSSYFTTVCGTVQDSVKVFGIYSINGVNTLKIDNYKISKNYGLVSYPPFEKLLFDIETNFLPKIEISKIENVSFASLKLSDVFALNIGDKRYWETYEEVYYPGAPIPTPRYVYDIDSIIGKTVSDDSIIYQVYSFASKSTFTEKYYYNYYKRIFDMEEGSYYLENDNFQYEELFFLKGSAGLYREYLQVNLYSRINLIFAPSGDILVGFTYSENFGLTQINNKSLIGSIVNGVRSGNTNDSIILSLPEKVETDLKIYPNPASEFIYLQSKTALGEIQIFSIQSQIIINKQTNDKDIQIDINALPKGIYFIKTQNVIQKIIKL